MVGIDRGLTWTPPPARPRQTVRRHRLLDADVADPKTWAFTGQDLTPEQIAGATAAVAEALRPTPPPTPTISKISFLRLLTPAEYAAFIKGADARSDAALRQGAARRGADADVDRTLVRADAAVLRRR
jgi:hypothetical protein